MDTEKEKLLPTLAELLAERGEEEGRKYAQELVARNLIHGGLSNDQVVEYTKLDLDEVVKLRISYGFNKMLVKREDLSPTFSMLCEIIEEEAIEMGWMEVQAQITQELIRRDYSDVKIAQITKLDLESVAKVRQYTR